MEPKGAPWTADRVPATEGTDDEDIAATPVRPPVALLAAAGATAAAALLLWIPGVLVLHYVGYVLATFVTLGLLAAFKRRDLRLRQSPFYSPQHRLRAWSIALAAGGVLVASAHIVPIALYWAA